MSIEYHIKLNLDNDAFVHHERGIELARILRELANRVEDFNFKHEQTEFPVRDINGNKIGVHGYTNSEGE